MAFPQPSSPFSFLLRGSRSSDQSLARVPLLSSLWYRVSPPVSLFHASRRGGSRLSYSAARLCAVRRGDEVVPLARVVQLDGVSGGRVCDLLERLQLNLRDVLLVVHERLARDVGVVPTGTAVASLDERLDLLRGFAIGVIHPQVERVVLCPGVNHRPGGGIPLADVRDVTHDAEDHERVLGLQVHENGDGGAVQSRLDDVVVVHARDEDVPGDALSLPPTKILHDGLAGGPPRKAGCNCGRNR